MRRLHALVLAVGLAAAPTSALATPTPHPAGPAPGWSMATAPARLGVMVLELTPELRAHFGADRDRGVLVGRVEPGSPAERAGVRVGDVLVEVRGAPVDDAPDVLAALAVAPRDQAIPVIVMRDRARVTLQARLDGARPASAVLDAFPAWLRDLLRGAGEGGASRIASG